MKRFILIIVCVLLACALATAQRNSECPSVTYADKNQIALNPIVLKTISGRILAEGDAAPLDVCVAVFTKSGKKLLATTVPNEKGEFHFRKLPRGSYRLVVKHTFNRYCVANRLITIRTKASAKKAVRVVLNPGGIDECSRIEIAH
jgi:hypothetical protein